MSNQSASTRNRQARFFLHEACEPLPLRQGQYHTHNGKIDSIDTTQSLKDSVSPLHHPPCTPLHPLLSVEKNWRIPRFSVRKETDVDSLSETWGAFEHKTDKP